MLVYEIELTLMEKVFFASREIDRFFLTEPAVGNYALAYAFHLAAAPYHVESVKKEKPCYAADMASLNSRGIYLTPATPVEQPRFELERFNATTDSYWYMMSNNVVVGHLDYKGNGKRPRPANFPQEGRLRLLSRGNRFSLFLTAGTAVDLPPYVRLGKFNSKARVQVRGVWENPPREEKENLILHYFLNPMDLPEGCQLLFYNILSVPPVPLIRDAVLSGTFYRIGDRYLPAGMRYGGFVP